MQGPRFSTKAESEMYRSWGADIIGMTALTESKLAREAEICYSTLACVTDYDCWHESEESVTIEMVVANLTHNVATAKRTLETVAAGLPEIRDCECASALNNSIITAPDLIPEDRKKQLDLLIGKYVS
jgi:5'-methylthioadenosine phosphorylase